MRSTTDEYDDKQQYFSREYLNEIYQIGCEFDSNLGSDIMQGWKREFISQIIEKYEHNLDGSGNNALHMIIFSLSNLYAQKMNKLRDMFQLFLPFLHISPELLRQKNAAGATALRILLIECEKFETIESIKIFMLLVRSGASLYEATQCPKAKAGYQKLIKEFKLGDQDKEKFIQEIGLHLIANPSFHLALASKYKRFVITEDELLRKQYFDYDYTSHKAESALSTLNQELNSITAPIFGPEGHNFKSYLVEYIIQTLTDAEATLQLTLFIMEDNLVNNIQLAPGAIDLLKAKGLNIDSAFVGDCTCILSYKSRSNLLEKLLESGANPDFCNWQDETPLHIAARSSMGHITIPLLLSYNANPVAKDSDSHNPLTIAVKERNLKKINDLLHVHLQYSAKQMMQSKYNYIQSALQHSWNQKDMEIVQMLLNFYVGNGDAPNNHHTYDSFFDEQFQPSFLIWAIEYQNHSIVKFILENYLSDVRIKNQNGYDALFYAVTRESFAIAKTLLGNEVNRTRLYAQYKIGLNEDDIGTSTLAHWAAYNNKAKILYEIWNTQYATFNVKDYMDRLPLHIAILHSDIDVVLNIIEKSYDHNWNRQDASGKTFLHNALERGNLSIIKKLITVGADITIKDSNGFTPLMIAARDSSNEIFEVLAKHPKVKKALDDVNELDYNRSVAHYIAMSGSAFKKFAAFPDGISFIPQEYIMDVEYCIDSLGNTLIHYAVLSGNIMLIASLMDFSTKSGIFINHQNYEGQTAFHLAAGAKMNPEIFKSFLSNGAIMIGDDYNNMLLHYAARYNRTENIMPLISLGADLDARNQYGNQPIHIAAGYANAAVIKILVDAGADIESVNKSGQTPLDIAVKYENSVTLKALIEAGANSVGIA